MAEDSERLVAEIPAELKRFVDADKRTNKEIVEAALWREFGGEREAAIDRRIDEKKNRISMIESEKNERERELQEQRKELEALEAKREAVQDQQPYNNSLMALLKEIKDTDSRIWEGHAEIEEIAKDWGKDSATVIEDAKEIAMAMDETYYNTEFVTMAQARQIEKQPLGEGQ